MGMTFSEGDILESPPPKGGDLDVEYVFKKDFECNTGTGYAYIVRTALGISDCEAKEDGRPVYKKGKCAFAKNVPVDQCKKLCDRAASEDEQGLACNGFTFVPAGANEEFAESACWFVQGPLDDNHLNKAGSTCFYVRSVPSPELQGSSMELDPDAAQAVAAGSRTHAKTDSNENSRTNDAREGLNDNVDDETRAKNIQDIEDQKIKERREAEALSMEKYAKISGHVANHISNDTKERQTEIRHGNKPYNRKARSRCSKEALAAYIVQPDDPNYPISCSQSDMKGGNDSKWTWCRVAHAKSPQTCEAICSAARGEGEENDNTGDEMDDSCSGFTFIDPSDLALAASSVANNTILPKNTGICEFVRQTFSKYETARNDVSCYQPHTSNGETEPLCIYHPKDDESSLCDYAPALHVRGREVAPATCKAKLQDDLDALHRCENRAIDLKTSKACLEIKRNPEAAGEKLCRFDKGKCVGLKSYNDKKCATVKALSNSDACDSVVGRGTHEAQCVSKRKEHSKLCKSVKSLDNSKACLALRSEPPAGSSICEYIEPKKHKVSGEVMKSAQCIAKNPLWPEHVKRCSDVTVLTTSLPCLSVKKEEVPRESLCRYLEARQSGQRCKYERADPSKPRCKYRPATVGKDASCIEILTKDKILCRQVKKLEDDKECIGVGTTAGVCISLKKGDESLCEFGIPNELLQNSNACERVVGKALPARCVAIDSFHDGLCSSVEDLIDSRACLNVLKSPRACTYREGVDHIVVAASERLSRCEYVRIFFFQKFSLRLSTFQLTLQLQSPERNGKRLCSYTSGKALCDYRAKTEKYPALCAAIDPKHASLCKSVIDLSTETACLSVQTNAKCKPLPAEERNRDAIRRCTEVRGSALRNEEMCHSVRSGIPLCRYIPSEGTRLCNYIPRVRKRTGDIPARCEAIDSVNAEKCSAAVKGGAKVCLSIKIPSVLCDYTKSEGKSLCKYDSNARTCTAIEKHDEPLCSAVHDLSNEVACKSIGIASAFCTAKLPRHDKLCAAVTDLTSEVSCLKVVSPMTDAQCIALQKKDAKACGEVKFLDNDIACLSVYSNETIIPASCTVRNPMDLEGKKICNAVRNLKTPEFCEAIKQGEKLCVYTFFF
eukprot:g4401.t1